MLYYSLKSICKSSFAHGKRLKRIIGIGEKLSTRLNIGTSKQAENSRRSHVLTKVSAFSKYCRSCIGHDYLGYMHASPKGVPFFRTLLPRGHSPPPRSVSFLFSNGYDRSPEPRCTIVRVETWKTAASLSSPRHEFSTEWASILCRETSRRLLRFQFTSVARV